MRSHTNSAGIDELQSRASLGNINTLGGLIMKQRNEFDYDVRVIERNLRERVITKEEYEEHLKNLPDVSDEGCPLVIDGELIEGSETQLNGGEEEST